MGVRISSELLDAIVAEAGASPDHEVCGLLLGSPRGVRDERVSSARSCRNVAADPERGFEIDPAALFAAIRAERGGGPPILGHYHSHPNGSARPSTCDAAMADRPGRLWLIVADGAVAVWREAPGGPVEAAFEPVRLIVDR